MDTRQKSDGGVGGEEGATVQPRYQSSRGESKKT